MSRKIFDHHRNFRKASTTFTQDIHRGEDVYFPAPEIQKGDGETTKEQIVKVSHKSRRAKRKRGRR